MNRDTPKIYLKSGKDRPVWQRHPWLFSGAIKEIKGQVGEGDVVFVCDNHGKIIARGFYSAKSQISVRLFDFGEEEVQKSLEESITDKIKRAYTLRTRHVITPQTNAYRLIHAEGDFFPGIIVDVYDQIAVCQFLITGTAYWANFILNTIQSITGIKYFYIKTKTSTTELENVPLPSGWWQHIPPDYSEKYFIFLENGFKFFLDPDKGQKTGFFLDQRENRRKIEKLSHQKSVLNTFSYTGGFSVAALRGGAIKVVSVDSSKEAVSQCEQTIYLNFSNTDRHQAVVADVFDYLKKSIELFDLVILDPPAFAKTAKAVANASRGYKELNMLGIKKTKPGGLLATFSCSQNISADLFQKIIFSAAADVQRNVRIVEKLTQPADHPINIFHPESEYLKGLLLYVE